jgi:hypothetical protein
MKRWKPYHSIGQRVEILQNGGCYSTYRQRVRDLRLKYWCYDYTPPNGAIGEYLGTIENVAGIRLNKTEVLKLRPNGLSRIDDQLRLKKHGYNYVDVMIQNSPEHLLYYHPDNKLDFTDDKIDLPNEWFDINV